MATAPLMSGIPADVPNFLWVSTDGDVNHGWNKVGIAPNSQTVFA